MPESDTFLLPEGKICYMTVFILLIGRETEPHLGKIYYRDYEYLNKTLTDVEIESLTTSLFRRYFTIQPSIENVYRTAELYGLFARSPDEELDSNILRERIARHFYHAFSREKVEGHIQIIPHFYGCEYFTIFDYDNEYFNKGSNMSLKDPDMKVIDKLIADAMGWEDDLIFRAKVYLEASL